MTDREILEKLLGEITAIKDDIRNVKDETRHLKVVLENTIPKQIQLIAEQHGDIIAKLDAIADYPETRGRVSTLENVAMRQGKDITELKKRIG